MDVCVFIEGHFTWKIGSLVTAGKVGNSLVTARDGLVTAGSSVLE